MDCAGAVSLLTSPGGNAGPKMSWQVSGCVRGLWEGPDAEAASHCSPRPRSPRPDAKRRSDPAPRADATGSSSRGAAGRRCIAAESRSHTLRSAGLWPALGSPASRRWWGRPLSLAGRVRALPRLPKPPVGGWPAGGRRSQVGAAGRRQGARCADHVEARRAKALRASSIHSTDEAVSAARPQSARPSGAVPKTAWAGPQCTVST